MGKERGCRPNTGQLLLGIDEPPKEGEYFIDFWAFRGDRFKLSSKECNAIEDEFTRSPTEALKATDVPHIAAWLKANEKPLAIVVEATKRPKYYNPAFRWKAGDDPGVLGAMVSPSVPKCREFVNALTSRAMLRLAEGKTEEAWQDLLACHRLARLIGSGGTLIEELVCIALDHLTSYRDVTFLDRANLSAKQIRDCLKDLQALPPLSPPADKVDLGDRYVFLDTMQSLRYTGVELLQRAADKGETDKAVFTLFGGLAGKPTEAELKALALLDWEPAVQTANELHDRMAAALRHKDRAARLEAFEKINIDLDVTLKGMKDQAKVLKDLREGKAVNKEVGNDICRLYIGLVFPAYQKVMEAHDRGEQIQRNLHVAFALALYHADNGKYPAKLADLAPKYIASVPGDIFSGKPLIYKPTENGFVLYSVGENGKDDDGRMRGEEPFGGDDLRFRLPVPPLKKN